MSPRIVFAVLLTALPALPAGAESFKSWAARGAREEREKDLKAAHSSYSNALSMWDEEDGKAPKAKVLCARGALREKNGDDEGALADLSDCLALDKKNARAFHRRGALLLKGGKPDRAISDFYKAVALDFGFAAAYADRARAYEAQGETAFAREDHKRACELGVKASCAKAKALAPKPKPAGKKAKPAPAPDPEQAPTEDATAIEEGSAPAGEETAAPAETREPSAETAPPNRKKPAKTWSAPYQPKFKDCLDSLQACVDDGGSYGACIDAASACEQKPKKGCCPAACFKAYRKSMGRISEAQAFRENFSLDAPCGVPPKEEED